MIFRRLRRSKVAATGGLVEKRKCSGIKKGFPNPPHQGMAVVSISHCQPKFTVIHHRDSSTAFQAGKGWIQMT